MLLLLKYPCGVYLSFGDFSIEAGSKLKLGYLSFSMDVVCCCYFGL